MNPADPAAAVAVLRHARIVLLDFDGPVCSIFAGLPAPQVAADLAQVLRTHGIAVPVDVVGRGDPLDVLRCAGPNSTADAEEALRRAELLAADSAQPTPGASDFLAACEATGRPVAVVSNNSGPAVARYLDRLGLAPLVTHIEARDPADPALMKPHPALVTRALNALRAEPAAAVLIGDSTTDVAAAQTAHVHVLGYANKPGKDRALADAGADAITDSMAQLADLTRRTPAS